MDLKHFDVKAAASQARELRLFDPTGVETDVVLMVLGYDADEVVEAARSVARDQMGKKSGKADFANLMQDQRLAKACAALVGWRNFGWGEDDSKFTPELAREVLSEPGCVWIIDQIEAFGGDRANLFPEPPKA